jgi:hypothetical protein
MPPIFNKIQAGLKSEDQPISKAVFINWMQSSSLDELALVSRFILEKKYADRISPPLTFQEAFSFLLMYFERCLIENPESDWAATRYEAGRELTFLIKSLWRTGDFSIDALANLKEWLARLYKSGDAELRDGILNGILEHLFEEASLKIHFEDWKEDGELAPAYAAACSWSARE